MAIAVKSWSLPSIQSHYAKQESLCPGVHSQGAKDKMGVKDGSDQEALIASGVSRLVTTLNEFAQKQRIDGQIRDAKQLLDSTINHLRSLLEIERDNLQGQLGEFWVQEQVDGLLENSEQEAEELIYNFRRDVLESFPNWQDNLSTTASSICNDVEQWVKENARSLWENNYIDIIYDPSEGNYSSPGIESFLGQIEVGVWKILADRMPLLAKEMARIYEIRIQNDQLAERLFKQVHNYINLEEIKENFERLIKEMETTLEKISSRIAHTVITDPTNLLIAEFSDSQSLGRSSLVTSLSDVPEPSKVSDSDFDTFISQVRQRYQTVVTEESVRSLLNIFRYETLLIRNSLRGLIRSVFSDMSRDSEYMNQIAAELSASNEDVAKLSLLNQKLRELSDI